MIISESATSMHMSHADGHTGQSQHQYSAAQSPTKCASSERFTDTYATSDYLQNK